MSPFYKKEGENWVKLGKAPIDIHVGPQGKDFITVFSAKDPEQIRISLQGDVIVRDEDGSIIYPGQLDTNGDHVLINRRDIIIEHTRGSDRKLIIHSEKPIGEK